MAILGLDLGSSSYRAVELEKEKDKIVLKKFGTYHNKHKIGTDEEDISKSANSIKDFISDTGFSTPNVIVALPETEVFTRVIKVPKMSEKELKSSIAYEAEQYIPLPLKEVSYDFQVMDVDITDKDKLNVLLVASKNETLTKYTSVLKNAKLIPKSMEPETLSISRVLGDTESRPSASIIINIGSKNSQIIISYKGFVRFTRSISIGGEALTRAVAQTLNLELAQAEEYKVTYGLDSSQVEGKVFGAIKPVFDNIISEVKRSKVFYTTHNPNVIINRVILSGGTALMPGLLFYAASNLDMEVELANPWRNIFFNDKVIAQKDILMEQGPLYVTAVGLALQSFM